LQKTKDFSKIMMCLHGQGGCIVVILQTREEVSFLQFLYNCFQQNLTPPSAL